MGHEVDHDCGGQDQDRVLALVDVDRVRVRETEPLLARPRHLAAAPLEGVLVVEEVALGFEVIGAGHVDGEPGAKQCEQVLLHDRHGRVSADDLVLRAEAQQLLLDPGELVAFHVLERELVAEAEDLAVDIVRIATVGVLDGEVVAPDRIFSRIT